MKIAYVKTSEDNCFIAAIEGEKAFNLTQDGGPKTIAEAMSALDKGLLAARCTAATEIEAGKLTLLAPIDPDVRVLCTGFNYANHAVESAREIPENPTFFMRYASGLVGHDEPIIVPNASEQLDWEGEIAFVIKRAGRAISKADAYDYVGGYVCFGDHSVRDFQLHGSQATAGKNFDRTGSIGPWIVSADEIKSPNELELFTRLNDEQVQHGMLSDLVFDIPALIAYISTFMTIRPGDVIATGTPAGIGGRRVPPRWMRPGETISVEVPGIGILTNPIISEEKKT